MLEHVAQRSCKFLVPGGVQVDEAWGPERTGTATGVVQGNHACGRGVGT